MRISWIHVNSSSVAKLAQFKGGERSTRNDTGHYHLPCYCGNISYEKVSNYYHGVLNLRI